ncbi:MAG: hypothetical protein B0D91_01865 [Oceanospirillales bacterium LUC14_002_19_P2]|nr:MAG: hypothetical protein B0D91_01865 [Oceanospirillales bacterium LUC14_002_19_P2]
MKHSHLAIKLIHLGSFLLLTAFPIAHAADDETDACITREIPISIINTYHFFYQNPNKALLVIRTPEALNALPNSSKMAENIDFNTQVALYAQMGTQPSGGHHIHITAVLDKCHYLEVRVENQQPGAGCITTQALTFPHQLVTLPKPQKQKPIIFKEVFSKESCL